MTLPEFLLARIAEDRAAASPTAAELTASRIPGGIGGQAAARISSEPVGQGQWNRLRVLTECDAKRQLVELHSENTTIPGLETLQCWVCGVEYPCTTLRLIALPYVDHPEYHPGWRPE